MGASHFPLAPTMIEEAVSPRLPAEYETALQPRASALASRGSCYEFQPRFRLSAAILCCSFISVLGDVIPLSLLCDDPTAATCVVSSARELFSETMPCNNYLNDCVPQYQLVMNASLEVNAPLTCSLRGYFKACEIQINTTFPVHLSAAASIKVKLN
jgi:hypothetical protein